MKIRKLLALLLGVLLLLGMAGCAAESMEPAAGSDMYAPTEGVLNRYEQITEGKPSLEAESTASLPENRKLIQTIDMDVETEDLDALLQQFDSRIAELGGYVQSSNVQNGSYYSGKRYRNASITARIPAKSVGEFVDHVGQITNIVSSRKTVDDVTLRYVETEGRMKALQVEQERLLELLAKAETMDDLLKIEDRLTDVRAELEQVTSALKTLDNKVDYATVYLSISEVKEYTEVTEPETLWERIVGAFVAGWESLGIVLQELLVVFVAISPYLLVMGCMIAVVVLIVYLIIRKIRKAIK